MVRWADELTQIQIYAAFVEYKQRFDIEFPFNPADMAMNIFYIFNGHYAAFPAEGKNNTKQLENDLERRISIVLRFRNSSALPSNPPERTGAKSERQSTSRKAAEQQAFFGERFPSYPGAVAIHAAPRTSSFSRTH
ncbi:MAG: hypothetical protein R3C55_15935 [Parvularculaceae bacterium]